MVTTDRRVTHEFPDGSQVEWRVRPADAAVAEILATELSRRADHARHRLGLDPDLTEFRPVHAADTTRSTTTYGVPGGEVTVSIDATATGTHEYLSRLTRGAVAYARALHLEPVGATLLATGLLAVAAGFALAGVPALGLPLAGAGGVVGLQVVAYLLATRGVPLGVSRLQVPGDEPV